MTDIVVLRVERPYATEAAFLKSESWSVTKKSVFLIGVPAYSEGTIARCELVLANGSQLLVAEGTVAKYVSATSDRPAGLVVRYRRMTPASSQFLNRALSAREAGEASASDHQVPADVPLGRRPPIISKPKGQAKPRSPGSEEQNTQLILQRLSGRRTGGVDVPTTRATLLSRLRMRTAQNQSR
jgi:hypothetical protein